MSVETATVKSSFSSFTEDEQHVAGNAHNFFKAGQYDAAIGTLKKIQKLHSNDPRLMHNRALAEFCKSSQTKVSEFRKNLIKIHKMVQQSHKEDEDFEGSGEKNNFMSLHFNQALLYFNMHQYSECESILEDLHNNSEVVEDVFFLKVCLLLVDAHLAMYNSSKAGILISAVEKTFLSGDESSANLKSSNSEDKSKQTPTLNPQEVESLRCYMHFAKARCHLQQKSVKACKREIKMLSPLGSANTSSTSSNQFAISQIASVFLKSHFEFVRCNYHKAYKILATSSPYVGSPGHSYSNAFNDSMPGMYYNNLGVIHFYMAKYNLATFYMQKALQENEKYFNESLRQHQQQNSGGRHQQQSSLKPLVLLHCNKRFELLYNCGLQLLYAGKPSSAFECLVAAVPAYHSNPKLWLRLAECCVHKCTNQGIEGDAVVKGGKRNHTHQQVTGGPQFTTIGIGPHRKVVINTIPTLKGVKSSNVAMPAPTLEFASLCLNNALNILQGAMESKKENANLVDQDQNIDSGTGSSDNGKSLTLGPVFCPPGPPSSGDQLLHLYASVLTNSAFVALQLGNGLQALLYSQTLLSLPKLSGCHRYLGHMYAAEALVNLDRISDAIQHLSIDKIASVSCSLEENGKKSPTSDEGSQKSGTDNGGDQALLHQKVLQRRSDPSSPWHYPTSIGCGHAYMLLNLATSHCLRSEFDKAQRLLRHASGLLGSKKPPPQAVLLAVYLSLNGGGGTSVAVQILKRNALIAKPPAFLPQPQQAGGGSASGGARAFASVAAGNSSPSYGGSGSESSSSLTLNRPKSGTPQPASGGVTPERVVKGKGEGKSKRNRR